MNTKNNLAFPLVCNDLSANKIVEGGLTKFEWFAGMALNGLLADGGRLDSFENVAKSAFTLAETMIKESEKYSKG